MTVWTGFREIRTSGATFQGLSLHNPRPKMSRGRNSWCRWEKVSMRGASPDKNFIGGVQPIHSRGEGGRPGVSAQSSLPTGQSQPEVFQLVMMFVQLSRSRRRAWWEGAEEPIWRGTGKASGPLAGLQSSVNFLLYSQVKPFYHMKPLSEADREKASKQKIPKFMELLKLAQREKKLVIFDLNVPPRQHPARSAYIQIAVREILDSQIEQHLIIWLPGSQREYVRSRAPGFQHIGRLFTIEQLTKQNITRINVDYKRLFYNGLREYKAANISINLYIINEPWLFSLAWCSRIQSVTTDNIQVLNKINHPYYFMTPNFYMLMWILMDCASAIFIVAIFYFHWWRESQSEKVLRGISSYAETPSISLQKEEPLEVMESPEPLTKSVGELPESTAVIQEPA